MKWRLGFSTFLMSFFIVGGVHAQSLTPELIEVKTQLESKISDKLRNSIGTTLEKSAFNVSVDVKLIEVRENVKREPSNSASPVGIMPSDISLGLIDVEQLLDRYKTEIETLKIRQAPNSVATLKNYKIQAINVLVGISDTFSDEYSKEFEKWLTSRVKADFGSAGKASVTKIKVKPKVEEPEKSWLEKLSDIQQLLAALVLGSFLFLILLLWKFLGSKDAAEQRRLAIQLQQMMASNQQTRDITPPKDEKLLDKAKDRPQELQIAMHTELRTIRDLTGKIALLANEQGTELNNVFSSWLEAGERGRFKLACLLDTLITSGGGSRANRDPLPELASRWQIQIPPEHQSSMLEVFKKMSALMPDSKRKLMEEVYWDLMAVKTMGGKHLHQPLGFVTQIEPERLKPLLLGQNPKLRAVVVLQMPQEAKEKFLKTMSFEEKRDLLNESLSMDEVLETDVETVGEAIKYQVKQMDKDEGKISLKPLIPQLIEAFSVIEEIKLLREISPKLSDKGLSIKQSFPSLAFLDEWPLDALKQFLGGTSTEEVYSILRLVPEMKEKILSVCPSKVVAIVSDDLEREERMKEEDRVKHISSLKLKMMKLLNAGQLDLSKVFAANDSSSEVSRAA